MLAAIYARKSTEESGVAADAKSVTRQVEGARAFIAARGWTINDASVYVDDGVSGALFANRPAFQRMMRDAEGGAFEAVVLFDLDRFGRNGRRSMDALYTLADLGVTVWDYSTGQAIDLDSLEGEMSTFMKARFAQQFRDQVRKHTREAMRRKAEQGYVTGGRVFGYDNVRIGKGQTERRINAGEAAVVRDIYTRAAAGEGHRTIAGSLNQAGVPSPRAQQGRPSGWSASTIRAVLERPLYRGESVWGRTVSAYGRELGKQRRRADGQAREFGQIPRPEATWLRREVPALRIIDPELATRVDARRLDLRTRYIDAITQNTGRVPQRAHGRYLLTGGMLICPTCGGHFEALKRPWKETVYICATSRRKPGICKNTLVLPLAQTDETVLEMVEGEVLGTRVIEELLMLVDRHGVDDSAHLTADRERLQREIDNLMELVANGAPAATVAPKIREREVEKTKIEAKLRAPRPEVPDLKKLRAAALEQRSAQWKADLRAEPKVARLLLRRLIGPIELWEPRPAFVRWEAPAKPALLDGLVHDVASPPGFEPGFWP